MILKKENGVVTEITKKELPKGKEIVHLCKDCQNACPSLCEKVADIFVSSQTTEDDLNNYKTKQPIGNYSYIDGGYQVLDNDGNVTKLIVNECRKYIKNIESRKLTRKEIEAKNKALEFLLLYYTNTGTIEDAEKVLEYQHSQGILVHKKRK